MLTAMSWLKIFLVKLILCIGISTFARDERMQKSTGRHSLEESSGRQGAPVRTIEEPKD